MCLQTLSHERMIAWPHRADQYCENTYIVAIDVQAAASPTAEMCQNKSGRSRAMYGLSAILSAYQAHHPSRVALGRYEYQGLP